MFAGAFQLDAFQNNAFQIKAHGERPAGGLSYWPERPHRYVEDRIQQLPVQVVNAIEKAASVESEDRADILRHDLAGMQDHFIRLYIVLMERLIEERNAFNDWLLEQQIKQREEEDLICAYLLLS